jgi:hypothetical protein
MLAAVVEAQTSLAFEQSEAQAAGVMQPLAPEAQDRRVLQIQAVVAVAVQEVL